MHRIKKILYYSLIMLGFALCFIFGKEKINVLAYSDIGNAFGSYPVKLDYENYNFTNNIFDIDTGYYCIPISQTEFDVLSGDVISYSFTDGTISINNSSPWSGWCSSYIPVEPNTTYTFTATTNLINGLINKTAGSFSAYSSNLTPVFGSWLDSYRTSNGWYVQYTTPSNVRYLRFALYTRGTEGIDADFGPRSYNIIKPQLYFGETPTLYSIPFKFGYNVHYNVVLSNSSSSNINAGIGIYDGNKYLYSANCNVPANSNGTICSSSNNPVYLPFNIDNNGYISFNYNLSLTVGPQSSISIKDGGLAFQTVFNAYYKGEYTENLYFKQTYTMNNISLSGFSISATNSNSNDIIFPSTSYDNVFIINSNNEYNISTNKKFNTTFTNNFNYKNFIYDNVNNIYDFAIKIPDDNIGINYNISISNLMARVVGDTGNVAPLPGNPNTIKKYNECSAWYDIPCQLGNAVTYVIYEAPIISPIINFFNSFIDLIESLVTYITWFEGLGLIFIVFIVILFIRIIILLVKGGNDD